MTRHSTLIGDLYAMKRTVERLSDDVARLPRDAYAIKLQNNIAVIEQFIDNSIRDIRLRSANHDD